MQSAAGLSTLHSGSPRNPPSLPRLPVPDLHKTLERYLKSLEPFLLEDAAVGGRSFDSSRELRVRWADEFERGLGKVCQDRLLGQSTTTAFCITLLRYKDACWKST